MVQSKTKNINYTSDVSLKPSYVIVYKFADPNNPFLNNEGAKNVLASKESQVRFKKYQIKETDMRVKTASFETRSSLDLTTGKIGVLILSPYHQNFGGIILSEEYDEDTGLYTYKCQDHSRSWQSKINLRSSTKYSRYQIIQSLLCDYVGNGYNVPKSLLKKCKVALSGLKPLSSYNEKKLGGVLNTNGLALKNNFIMEKTSMIDIIRNLAFSGNGAYIDVWIDEWGIVHIDPINKNTWLTSGIYITTPELAETKLGFDITNIITGVNLASESKLDSERMYTSKDVLGIDLTTYFGNFVTTIDNPNKTNTGSGSGSSKKENPGNGINVFINTDNIRGKSSDRKMMEDIAKYLQKRGYNTEIGGIGPSYHYSQVNKVKKNGIYLTIYGGLCAGTLKEQAESNHYKDVLKKKNAKMVIGLYNRTLTDDWLARAHDDNFSPPSFKGASGLRTKLLNAGYGIAEGKTAKAIADAFPGFKNDENFTQNTGSSTIDIDSAVYIQSEKQEALNTMTEQIRELLSVKIKFPVGNPVFKKLHTNSFLWTELPDNLINNLKISNFGKIANKMTGSYTRYSGYQLDRWYIEAVTITNDENSFDFEVELNPFPSPLSSYSKAVADAVNAYDSAMESNNSFNSSSVSIQKRSDGRTDCTGSYELATKQGTYPISSLQNKTESKLSQGKIGRNNTDYAKAVKGMTGKETYKHLQKRMHYVGYRNNRDKCANNTYLAKGANCADLSRLLKACLDVNDVPCVIYHVNNHYLNGVLINGKWETVDLCYQSGRYPQYQTAGWNK